MRAVVAKTLAFETVYGISLMVQCLRIQLAMQRMRVQSLVREIKSHMPHSN